VWDRFAAPQVEVSSLVLNTEVLMAVTNGHGNPAWTFDETILALELYFKFQEKNPNRNDPDVIQLSKLLNKLPIHSIELRKKSFRNPDGVAFKIQNLRSVATGKGLSNTSKTDKYIWESFGNKPDLVALLSQQIRDGISEFSEYDSIINEIDVHQVFHEGLVITAIHNKRERAKGLRPKLIKRRKIENQLHCEICGVTPLYTNIIDEASIFECHHVIPLHKLGSTKTTIDDVSLLCANCHKAIHAYISMHKQWITPKQMRELTKT